MNGYKEHIGKPDDSEVFAHARGLIISIERSINALPSAKPEIIRCKECKHFEYDHFENVNGIPLIVAHEICLRWGDGVKTSENGYCFLAERKDNG